MTTQTLNAPLSAGGLSWAIRDALALTWRNLLTIRRLPQLLVFATIQPLLFVLMFRYVFGGSIQVPGVDYVNYLMPGIFAQVVAFGAISTGIGLAEDRRNGLIERLRSLPMARSAVLAGRTLADLVRNVFVVMLMLGVGFAVGFRVETSAGPLDSRPAVAAARSGTRCPGCSPSSGSRCANAESRPGGLVPAALAARLRLERLRQHGNHARGWLQAFAEHQPVTAAVDAMRALVLGGPWGAKALETLAWSAGIVIVFGYLAVRRYRRAV